MRTNDGQEIIATTPKEIVAELHADSRAPAKNDRAFMQETADRIMAQFELRVRADRPENFIADLLKIGLLVEDK